MQVESFDEDRDEPIVVNNAYGCRRLLAAVLKCAVKDASLAEEPPRGLWPWPGVPLQVELDAFWRSAWLERICLWLDLDPDAVRAYVSSNGHQRDQECWEQLALPIDVDAW